MNIKYEKIDSISLDNTGRPIIDVMTIENLSRSKGADILSLLIDTGAGVSTVNKTTADTNKYVIVEKEAIVLFGFNDHGIIMRELKRLRLSDNEMSMAMTLGGMDLKRYIMSKGITDIGLVYDLRRIPTAVFCGYVVNDVIVASPNEDNAKITEILGMNVLGRFHTGLDFANKKIYLTLHDSYKCGNPKYTCGDITLAQSEYLDNVFKPSSVFTKKKG